MDVTSHWKPLQRECEVAALRLLGRAVLRIDPISIADLQGEIRLPHDKGIGVTITDPAARRVYLGETFQA